MISFRRTVWTGNPIAPLSTAVPHVLWEGPRAGIGGVELHWEYISETPSSDRPRIGLWVLDSNDGQNWTEVQLTGQGIAGEDAPGFYRSWVTFDSDDYSILLRVLFVCMITGTPSQPLFATVEGGLYFLPEEI